MKPMIETMKTRASHISVRTLALVLCFVMLIGAIGTGTVLTAIAKEFEPSGDAVLAAAALNGADVTVPEADDADESPDAEPDAKDNGDAADKNLVDDIIARLRTGKEDLAGTGANVDLVGTGTDYYIHYVTDNSKNSSQATSVQMTAASNGKYYASFTATNSNFDVMVNTSSTVGSILTSSTTRNASGVTVHGIEEGDGYYWLVGYASSGTTVYIIWDTTDSSITASNTAPSGSGGGGGGTPAAEDVSDADLLAVLRNQKIMYYGGELISWDQDTFYAMNTNNTSDAADSGTMSDEYDIDGNTEFTALCTAADSMYMGHWASGLSTTPEAGKAYIVRGSADSPTSGTLTKKVESGNDYLYEYTNSETTTATTTCSANIYVGQTLTASTSSSAGTSVLGASNSFKYYITSDSPIDDDSTFDEYTLTSGTIDTSALAIGTYTLVTVLYDGSIYISADSDTFTVNPWPALTTPTITLDSATGTGTSSQTASPTLTSTVTVTNTNASDYISGTVFKLYQSTDSGTTYSEVASNTTGTFTLARNTTTAGVYKVVAVPGESDTTHSNSADSNTPTLAITKIDAPVPPVISVDKTQIGRDETVKITVNNFDVYDLSIYNLYMAKVKDDTATQASVSSEAPTQISAATYVNRVDNSTQAHKKYAHYQLKVEAKDKTVYEDATPSNVLNIAIVKSEYYLNGDMVSSASGKWDYITDYPVEDYCSDGYYYRAVTVDGNNDDKHYFRVLTNSQQYPPTGATDTLMNGTDTNLHNSFATAVAINSSAGTNGAFYVTGPATYYVFIDQVTKKVWVRSSVFPVTITPKYQKMNLSTGEFNTAATDTDGTYIYSPTVSTVVDSGGTLTLTATVTNSDYEFVGWFDSNSDFNATPLSTDLSYTTAAISEAKTYYPLVREKVTRHNVTVKTNNARLGSGSAPATPVVGQTVTVTVSPNMGAFESITVKDASNNDVPTTTVTAGTTYTFVMPSTDATVNLTFNDYTAASPFYYNSYETNGSPSSTRYGQQMTEGKINGQEFSYYHVEGRTGSDHLFTVSYGSPVYNSYNTYFEIYSNWENGGVSAKFYATDGKNLGDFTGMTYDSEANSKKKFRIAIPDGAREVEFKNNNGGATTGKLSLYSGNNAYYVSGSNLTDVTGYNSSNPVPVNFYENFNGEGKYTANCKTKGFNNHNATRGESHAYTKPKNLGTDSGDYYIVVLYSGKTYTINGEQYTVDKNPEIIWMPKLPGTEDIDSSEVNVYGKDGPIVIDWNNKTASGATTTSGTAYGYSLIADTKLYDSDGTEIGTDVDDDGASYEKAKVVVTSEDSANIVVKTTIASDYRSKYYLKGWNINGVTYACGNNVKGVNDENAGSDGEYTMTYTIPAGTEDSANIEITPIYYLTSSYKTTNEIETVTFFLEGYSTITEKWGDTPYIYPFYGNLNNVDNSFGVYPGQPMVFASGQYSVEVPVNKNVPIAKSPGSTAVKGITINNGYADHVHRNLVYKWSDHDNDQEHKQTYDYDDFYKIYEECLTDASGNPAGHPNSIIFRIHDEETVFNRSQYGGGKSGQFASGTSNINISTIATSGNGWELLTNRYGQAINLFGAHVADPTTQTATTDTDNALYIVSTGYNANIAGDYGTMWKIYDGSGELISNAGGRVGVPPSVLLLRGDASGYSTNISYPSANRSVDGVGSYTDSIGDYEAIYKALHDSSYAGKRVYITYEKDAQDTRKVTSGTGANRLDGRWYYTHSSDKVKSTIGIEYWDNSQNKWVPDTMSGITGSNTQCTAKFTDNNTTTSNEYLISDGSTYNFTATTHSGWKFDSWQIKYSDTSYDPIDTSETASMPATASYEIVARFVPTTSGDLTINHTLNKASTGEGTVDMEVKVYSDSGKTTLVTDGSKTGSRVYLGETFINNDDAINYVIEITLKATPMYDGKVSEFTYDKFNEDNGITATTDPAALPGGENALTTSTFDIPVSALYNVGTQKTKVLNYTSLIDETLHYYNFVYNLTTRGDVSKTYTSKGVLNKTDYKKVVSDQEAHTLDNSILVDKAPFESNFLMSNTLSKGTISYADGTHTYTATSTFEQSGAVPKYHVVFKLPYEYMTSGDLSVTPPTKKYTVTSDKEYDNTTATFDLLAEYNTFVTVDATSSAIGTQENVDKVTDGSDINHAGNNFITAPEELYDSGTIMYFKYWDIKKLKSDGTAGDDVAKIYYPDFHYRVYNNYYVEAVYSDDAEDSWKHKYSEEDNNAVDCSVLYLGDSRNQWNDGTKADGYTTNSSSEAADMIYSDFIFHYTYKGQELKNVDDDDVEVGMILERATYWDTTENKAKWLTGSTSVNDMSYYRANYGGDGANSTELTRKEAILNALNGNTDLPSGTIQQQWQNSVLNNKNFTEQSYSVYSQYGQTVANDTITFAKDNTIDDYVYRAYAYIKGADGVYKLSEPVYFSMRYTSNLKYTE